MLILVDESKVGDIWEKIREIVLETLPPTASQDEVGLMHILRRLRAGELLLWMYMAEDGPLYGVITAEVQDAGTLELSTLIYSLFNFKEGVSLEAFSEGLGVLMDRAKKAGHKTICARTQRDGVDDLAKMFGARVDSVNIEWEIV